jgi:outer membrane lipoprotein carrier protein
VINRIHRRMILQLCLIALALTVPAATARAQADPANELIQVLSQSASLQGQFKQSQYDVSNTFMGESSGSFKMLRPGYFSWDITLPDSQLILATPHYIWHHDRDLETVTRRQSNNSAAVTPLQILGGNEELLRAQFNVEASAEGVFTLTPKAKEGGDAPVFSRLSLTVDSGVVSGMEIIDGLQQRLVIKFDAIDSTTQLTPESFEFTPPEGVDLFLYDE